IAKKVAQLEDQPAVAQGVAGQEPDVGKGVEHDALWLHPFDDLHDRLGDVVEFDVGRGEEAVFSRGNTTLNVREVDNLNSRKVPFVRPGGPTELGLGFREA